VAEDYAQANTDLMRHNSNPFWVRLRDLLAERGVAVERAALATSFPDDSNLEFGIVVTEDGNVFEFDFEYSRRGDLKEQASGGSLSAWDRTTDRWRERPFADEVEAARRLIGLRS